MVSGYLECEDSTIYIYFVAPTGSGKTVLFELALLACLQQGIDQCRAIYIAPTKVWNTKYDG
jgi:superfamily II DNA or RNA helicase